MNPSKALTLSIAVTLIAGTLAATTPAANRQSAHCNPYLKYCNPGVLPAGVYTTRYFLPGMRVPVPRGGWRSSQDSTDEFKLNAPHVPSATVRFWIDPRASTPCSAKVLPVEITTPARAARWLRGNKNLIVSAPVRTTIARHLRALRVDLDVAKTAPRCSRSCPGPRIGYFLFFGGVVPSPDLPPGHTPEITDGFGTGHSEPVRLYFAETGKPSHLLVVGVDTPNKRVFRTLTRTTVKLLARLRLPAKRPPKHP